MINSENTALNRTKEALQYFAAGATSCLVTAVAVLGNKTLTSYCPSFPEAVYTYAKSAQQLQMSSVQALPAMINRTVDYVVIQAPIFEETLFRYGLQELLLRELPKVTLKKFAPSYVDVVDSKVAKVARVGVSALAFCLMHAVRPEETSVTLFCSTARLTGVLALGILAGGVQEVTESTLLSILFHSGWNIVSLSV